MIDEELEILKFDNQSGAIILELLEDSFAIKEFDDMFKKWNKKYYLLPSSKMSENSLIPYPVDDEDLLKNFSLFIYKNSIDKLTISNKKKYTFYLNAFVRRNTQDFIENNTDFQNDSYKVGMNTDSVLFKINLNTLDNNFVKMLFTQIGPSNADFLHELSIERFINTFTNGSFLLLEKKIITLNDTFMKILGFSNKQDLINQPVAKFIAPSDIPKFFHGIEIPNQETIVKFIKKDGEEIYLSVTAGRFLNDYGENKYVINVIDVTERVNAQLFLIQTHRMASVGELTSGIAHEINNPLFGIINYAELVKDTLDSGSAITKDSEDYEFIIGIQKEADRISKIINNLAEFSRKSEDMEFTSGDIELIISKVEKLLAYQIRHSRVKIIKNINPDAKHVICQPHRLEHVIFNVMLNSIQSLQNVDGKERIIEITVEKCVEPNNNNNNNNAIQITIFDNGEGIDSNSLVKLFTPFFTTKRPGVGSGLGLYMAYKVINDHEGKIDVKSKYGEFCKFIITLPNKIPESS